MPTPRNHPSAYPPEMAHHFREPSTIHFDDEREAHAYRLRLYAFRECLREHPSFDLPLLLLANSTVIHLTGPSLTTEHRTPLTHQDP